MIPALIILAILLVTGLVLYLLDKRGSHDDAATAEPQPAPANGCDAACALSEVCPSEMMLRCADEPAVYYDDEELDAFAGREPGDYSAAEEEQWRDVLYTLQPADLMGWARSVKKRGIAMPAAIHEEFLMLVNERSNP